MSDFLTYIFWPNPGNATYQSPKVIALFIVCACIIGAWIMLKQWRKRLTNQVTKKLSRSWSTAALSFGVVGLFLIVSRVEQVSFLSMRFLWVLWGFCFLLYLAFQIRQFRARHYQIIETPKVEDPRDKYLPGSKNKRRK